MTPDELRKKLAEAGIGVGSWQEGGGKTVESPLLKRQKELLGRLETLLQQQVEQDTKKVAELQDTLFRLKHGGGR